MYIAVVNHSARIAETDLDLAVRAVAHQVRYDVAPEWGARSISVVHATAKSHIPAGAYVIGVYDDADQANALGYHSEQQDGTVYGKVFVAPVLDNGGSALDGPLSVSAVLSHEVLETFADPHVQLWASDGGNYLYAYEVCDAVEDSSYTVNVDGRHVAVSNFVTQAYFDAQAPKGAKLDFLGTLTKPFQIAKGGYAVRITLGKTTTVNQIFGDDYPAWKRETKKHPLARLARRAHSS